MMVSRKEIATSFLKMASSGKARDAFSRYVHPRFAHHNPYFKGDGDSLLAGMEASALEFPKRVFEVVHVVEEGGLVVVHTRVNLKPGMPEFALIHIFRFEGDLIIEEWEAAQAVPVESPNENGMF
jgi:predicted SnoaL-like aldol condensation-catalyzing enzyme